MVIVPQYNTTPVIVNDTTTFCGTDYVVLKSGVDTNNALSALHSKHACLFLFYCPIIRTGFTGFTLIPIIQASLTPATSILHPSIPNASQIHGPSLPPATSTVYPSIPTPSHIQGPSLPPATSRVHPYNQGTSLSPAISIIHACPSHIQAPPLPTYSHIHGPHLPTLSHIQGPPLPTYSHIHPYPPSATSRAHPYLPTATSMAHPSIPTSRCLYPWPASHISLFPTCLGFTACPVPVFTLCGVVDVYRDCVDFLTASEEKSDPSA